MPKEKRNVMLKRFVKLFGEQIFSTNNMVIYCNACNCEVIVTQKFQMTQHCQSQKHINAV